MALIDWVVGAVSIITILSCGFMKVPQIVRIRKARTADGLQIYAMVMEIVSYTTTTLYNFKNRYSILTYLEYPLILTQSYALLYYTLKFKRRLHYNVTISCVLIYVTVILSFLLNIFPAEILTYVTPMCTPISGFSKAMYIYGMIMDRNSDAVSLTTWVISIATNVARIFTVYVTSYDGNLIFNFVVSAILSTGVLITAMIFKYKPEPPPPCPVDLPRSRRKSTHVD